jgi:small subunit ribosomal protein S16
MLMIRFQRIGRKNDPAFRIAVLEKTSGPKAGKYVDLVGTHNPKTKESTLKPELIKEWMSKGAQLSPSVSNLLIAKGVLEGKKAQVISKKNLEKNILKQKAADEAAAKLAAEEAKAAEAKAAEDAAAKAAAAEAEATPVAEEPTPETPAEEAAPEVVEEAPVEVVEAPAPTEEVAVEAV